PAACRWYADHLRRLVHMGVDSFKADFGERIPTDVVYFDGSDPKKMHNYYAYLFNKVVFEALENEVGQGNAVLFSRSAAAGAQKFPVHWGGDCAATYPSMAESLRGGLSLGLSGFGFWSHDIGGFEDTATPDLYKRWVAFGLLSSHSRLHGSRSYRVPWLFDEEAVDVLRFFTKLKCRLMPYVFSAALEAAQRGLPVMRAMFLEFPRDPGCDYLDRQYMVGESLLIAPIFNPEGEVDYYLPKGKWTNILSNEIVDGGRWVKEQHDYMSLPLMVKENSIISVGKSDSVPDYDYTDGVTFHAFEIADQGTAGCLVYGIDGDAQMEITIQRQGERYNVVVADAKKPWSLIMRNKFELLNEEPLLWKGFTYNRTDQGIQIVPPEDVGEFSFTVR
ncbi:MAG: alpha-xylosidase, partial [Firmicutes bacterium]|nr:alpha-xylosidase [Bacillota bacterium]